MTEADWRSICTCGQQRRCPGCKLPLLDRDPTPEDLEASRDAPRPGVWAGEPGADLRLLTQDETDALIRWELWWTASAEERPDVLAATGPQHAVRLRMPPSMWRFTNGYLASRQRGGIDSDPLVRILARRAWGDRDRQWFALRGVRAGERVARMMTYAVALEWPGDRTRNADLLLGFALRDARPGEIVEVLTPESEVLSLRVSERLREPPDDWHAEDILVSLRESGRDRWTASGKVTEVAWTEFPRAPRPMSYAADDRITIDGREVRLVPSQRGPLMPATARPGARNPGAGSTPPIPPWARERRRRSPRPPTR